MKYVWRVSVLLLITSYHMHSVDLSYTWASAVYPCYRQQIEQKIEQKGDSSKRSCCQKAREFAINSFVQELWVKCCADEHVEQDEENKFSPEELADVLEGL